MDEGPLSHFTFLEELKMSASEQVLQPGSIQTLFYRCSDRVIIEMCSYFDHLNRKKGIF